MRGGDIEGATEAETGEDQKSILKMNLPLILPFSVKKYGLSHEQIGILRCYSEVVVYMAVRAYMVVFKRIWLDMYMVVSMQFPTYEHSSIHGSFYTASNFHLNAINRIISPTFV